MIIKLNKFILIIVFTTVLFTTLFAQTPLTKGIEHFNKGKNKEAISALKKASKTNSNDPEVWNYLGLSYLKVNDLENGLKAFETAVQLNGASSSYLTNLAYANLRSRNSEKTQELCSKAIEIDSANANAYYIRGTSYLWQAEFEKALSDAEIAIRIQPNLIQAYILKADTLVYGFGENWVKAGLNRDPKQFAVKNLTTIESAVDTLARCEVICEKSNLLESLIERKAKLIAFHKYFKDTANLANIGIDSPDDPTVKPVNILSKPFPSYTDSARNAGVQGSIQVSVVFGADGKVKNVFVVRGLGSGLDEQAVLAANKIKFEPAEKNGIPFSVLKILKYNFAIY